MGEKDSRPIGLVRFLEYPDGALNRWLVQKDDLLAGRTLRASGEGVSIHELVNRFLTAKVVAAGPRQADPTLVRGRLQNVRHFGRRLR